MLSESTEDWVPGVESLEREGPLDARKHHSTVLGEGVDPPHLPSSPSNSSEGVLRTLPPL